MVPRIKKHTEMKKIVGLIGLLILLNQPLFSQTVFWEANSVKSIPGVYFVRLVLQRKFYTGCVVLK
jgi:hypothetical protein